MSIKEQPLTEYLQDGDPYPCLSILESALVCYHVRDGRTVPEELLEDLKILYRVNSVEAEVNHLIDQEYIEFRDHSIALKSGMAAFVSEQLHEIKKNLPLTLHGKELTAGAFLESLAVYLAKEVDDLNVMASNGTELILEWKQKRYCLQLAISPAWLPAAAEKYAAESGFLALFGPFAAQNWQRMMKYYAYPEFRNHTAYFDPWNRQKMNISKGGLFAYFDRFFRDEYKLRILIPRELPAELHDLGLLRYNDEK